MNDTNEKSILYDVIDYSITEVIALQILLHKTEGIRKHHLYLELKQFFDNQKKISTSSIYNSLAKMENHGLIRTIETYGKKGLIEATDTLNPVLQSIEDLVIASSFSMSEIEINFIAEIEQRISLPNLGNVLMIDSSNYIDLQLLHYLQTRSDSISILSLNQINIDDLGIEDIYKVNLRGDNIREPAHTFDVVILPVYMRDFKDFPGSKTRFLQEMHRVMKTSGIMVVTAFSEFPQSDNYFANQLLLKYNKIMSERMITEEEIRLDFEEINPEKIDIFNYQGMIIGILWK